MAVLYVNKVHGSPELDLKLEISDGYVTATVYSANDYGGNFGYPGGIIYNISAGGTGFSINTGSFSYSTSGKVITSGGGQIGSGTLEVRTTCTGAGSCFDPDHICLPSYNDEKSSGTSGTITISGNFSDYAFIVISVDGNGISKSIVCLPYGSENIGVTYSSGSNNDLINRTALVYPSGSNLTWKRNYNVEIFNNNTVSFTDGVLKIIKIVGYKY